MVVACTTPAGQKDVEVDRLLNVGYIVCCTVVGLARLPDEDLKRLFGAERLGMGPLECHLAGQRSTLCWLQKRGGHLDCRCLGCSLGLCGGGRWA